MTIVLLTGDKGCGKTTACQRLAAELLAAKLGGALAPAIYDDDGTKTGIMMQDMATGQQRQLAKVVAIESGAVTVGQYAFDDAVTAWGLQCILSSLGAKTDLVFVDEIGPLELHKRAGFWPALAALDSMCARAAILIVRPSLVDELARMLAHLEPVIVSLSLENRDDVPRLLQSAVAG